MNVTIRAEGPGEADAVRAINDAAFGKPSDGAIVDAIRGTDRWIVGGSLVAEDPDGALVGHLLASEGDLDMPDGKIRRIWMVGPVAVIPARQRTGVGSALVQAVIELATERGQPLLCLLGHPSYYPRFGFEPARALGIDPARPWPDEAWMVRRLPAWSPSLRGVARFPDAFPDSQ
ncbi:MAG TPA: N-acetyltransferase [Candidatus Limnocylindrales bacterium]